MRMVQGMLAQAGGHGARVASPLRVATCPPRRPDLVPERRHFQPMTRLLIRAIDGDNRRGRIDMHLQGLDPVSVHLEGSGKHPVVLDVEWPDDARVIEIGGRFTFGAGDGAETREAVRRFLVRGAPGPVFGGAGDFDPSSAFGDFLRDEGVVPEFFAPPQAQTAADLDAAQTRLGFALDPDHRALLAALGPIQAHDFFMVDAHGLAPAIEQLQTLWGDAPGTIAGWPAATRELLARSTQVLVEAGDGYSALLWEGGDPGRPWWLAQDAMDRPEPLQDAQGRPLSFRAALGQVLTRMIDLYATRDGEPGKIDRRPGATNEFYLTIDPYGGGLVLDLVPA
jgi:hypothetical protein